MGAGAGGEAEIDALEGVSSLIDKNLARRAEGVEQWEGGEPRFVMLETIREFAREWLALSGEEAALRRRHAVHYESLLASAYTPIRAWRAQSFVWLDRLAREHDNLRAALRWLINQGEAERALESSAVLFLLWEHRGYFAEGRRWLEEMLALPGDLPAARAAWSAQLVLSQSAGEPLGIADSLERFAMLAAAEGDDERALRLVGAAEAIRETLGSPPGPGRAAELDTKLAHAMTSPSAHAAREAGRAMPVEEAIARALGAAPP